MVKMSNDYFSSYSFETPTTDEHVRKTKYTFQGPKDYIDSLKQRPVEVNSTQNVNGWQVRSKGYSNGVLKTTAEKMLGTRNVLIESIVSNKLPKFRTIELNEYDPLDPIHDVYTFVEVHDKQDKISPDFIKIDEQAEQPYERRFHKSSIVSISNFLRDPEFENMLKSVK